MADVFLSYARANAKAAKQVAAALRKPGFSVWFDEKLPAHRAYSDVIATELDSAAAVVVLWSTDAVQSQWVRSEANRARETGRLVQARLDHARLPMPFDQIECADLSKWKGSPSAAAWQQVVGSVGELAEPGGPRPAGSDASGGLDRRAILVGAAASAVLAVGGIAYWTQGRGDGGDAESRGLLQKGLDAIQSDDPDQRSQAIPLLTEATRLSPKFAEAWGALAVAYAAHKFTVDPPERIGFDQRARSAAQNALALKSDEPRALGALLWLEPVYHNWLKAEHDDRKALSRDPQHPLLLDALADFLGNVGRWREAIRYRNQMPAKFILPGADGSLVLARWSAGDLSGADDAVRQAIERWPGHEQIWRTRLLYLMHSGRADEALSLLEPTSLPARTPDDFVAAATVTAKALLGQVQPAAAVQGNLHFVRSSPSDALLVVLRCAALGDPQTVFELLEGYYFARGSWAAVAPQAGDEDRVSAPIFQPPMRNLWQDARFSSVLERTGLNDYWRRSRTVPDFRKGGAAG